MKSMDEEKRNFDPEEKESQKEQNASSGQEDKAAEQPKKTNMKHFSFGNFGGGKSDSDKDQNSGKESEAEQKKESAEEKNDKTSEPKVGSTIESLTPSADSEAEKDDASTGKKTHFTFPGFGKNKKEEKSKKMNFVFPESDDDQTPESPDDKETVDSSPSAEDNQVKPDGDAEGETDILSLDGLKDKEKEIENDASNSTSDSAGKDSELTKKQKEQKTQKRQGLPKRNSGKGLPKKERKKLKTWQKVLLVILGIILAGIIAAFVIYQANRVDISDYTYTQKQKTQVITSDNQVIAELFSQNRTYITLDQVPDDMKNALIATEDSRFYSHHGVDYWGIIRSLVANIVDRNATSQGASTLTQQLARTLFLPDISTEQTVWDSIVRKFKEISIAYQLEKKYSKDEILEMYLNETYFGSSAYGIEEAAKTYFGKDIWNCSLAECAMLAGLPQAPSAYAPNNNFDAAKARQEQVLDRMVKMGYITQDQCDQAKATAVTVVAWDASTLNNQVTEGYEDIVNMALEEYAEAEAPSVMKQQGLSESDAISSIRTQIAAGGYKIYITANSGMQNEANEVANSLYPSGSSVTTAIVSVDKDGAVRAYYGGNTDVDMADTARQPGSNIKPLYYSGAIDSGLYNANSILPNTERSYGGYTPHNHGGSSGGSVTLTTALVRSLNIPSVYLMYTYGVDNAINWMKTMGISTFTDSDANLAVAVGGLTDGIKPIEMAAAFNCFNNDGVYNEPYFVTQITTSNGDVVFTKDDLNLDSHQVMSSSTASTMKSILTKVVTSGTGTAAATGYTTAGKTGTTDEAKDVWFTGMTGDITTSIWVGSPDHDVTISGESTTACRVYRAYVGPICRAGLVTGL